MDYLTVLSKVIDNVTFESVDFEEELKALHYFYVLGGNFLHIWIYNDGTVSVIKSIWESKYKKWVYKEKTFK